MMKHPFRLAVPIASILVAAAAALWHAPRPEAQTQQQQQPPPPQQQQQQQTPDVLLNVIASGARKLNIVVPNFTVVGGTDSQALARSVPTVTANDLRFSALFSV